MISSKPGTIGHGGIVANRQRAFQMRFIGRLQEISKQLKAGKPAAANQEK